MTYRHWWRTTLAVAAFVAGACLLLAGALFAAGHLFVGVMRALFSIRGDGYAYTIAPGPGLAWCVAMALLVWALVRLRRHLADEFVPETEWALLAGRPPFWSIGLRSASLASGAFLALVAVIGVALVAGALLR